MALVSRAGLAKLEAAVRWLGKVKPSTACERQALQFHR